MAKSRANQQRNKEKLPARKVEDALELPNDDDIGAENLEVILEDVPEDVKNKILKSITVFAERHEGPLPSPKTLDGYEKAMPGAGERIFKMAETQALHRQQIENKLVNGDNFRGWFLPILSFVSLLVLTAVATYLALNELVAVAIAIFTTTIIGVGIGFYVNQRAIKTEK